MSIFQSTPRMVTICWFICESSDWRKMSQHVRSSAELKLNVEAASMLRFGRLQHENGGSYGIIDVEANGGCKVQLPVNNY